MAQQSAADRFETRAAAARFASRPDPAGSTFQSKYPAGSVGFNADVARERAHGSQGRQVIPSQPTAEEAKALAGYIDVLPGYNKHGVPGAAHGPSDLPGGGVHPYELAPKEVSWLDAPVYPPSEYRNLSPLGAIGPNAAEVVRSIAAIPRSMIGAVAPSIEDAVSDMPGPMGGLIDKNRDPVGPRSSLQDAALGMATAPFTAVRGIADEGMRGADAALAFTLPDELYRAKESPEQAYGNIHGDTDTAMAVLASEAPLEALGRIIPAGVGAIKLGSIPTMGNLPMIESVGRESIKQGADAAMRRSVAAIPSADSLQGAASSIRDATGKISPLPRAGPAIGAVAGTVGGIGPLEGGALGLGADIATRSLIRGGGNAMASGLESLARFRNKLFDTPPAEVAQMPLSPSDPLPFTAPQPEPWEQWNNYPQVSLRATPETSGTMQGPAIEPEPGPFAGQLRATPETSGTMQGPAIEPDGSPITEAPRAIRKIEEFLAPSGKKAARSVGRGVASDLYDLNPELAGATTEAAFDKTLMQMFDSAAQEIDTAESAIPRDAQVPRTPIVDAFNSLAEEYELENNVPAATRLKKLAERWSGGDGASPTIPWDQFRDMKRSFAEANPMRGPMKRAYQALRDASAGVSDDLSIANWKYSRTIQALDDAGIDPYTGRRDVAIGKAPDFKSIGARAEADSLFEQSRRRTEAERRRLPATSEESALPSEESQRPSAPLQVQPSAPSAHVEQGTVYLNGKEPIALVDPVTGGVAKWHRSVTAAERAAVEQQLAPPSAE